MKRFIISFLLISGLVGGSAYAAQNLQNTITSGVAEVIPNVQSVSKTINYAQIAKEIQFWIFVFIGIIAVVYIIIIGAKLLWAPGSMEEMSTSLKALAYVVIGLALMPFAYFLVNFIIHIRL